MSNKDAINRAFQAQYAESIKNPAKTLDGHIANENNVTNDYRGRVLYEFFQNAVDRATSKIWIIMDSEKQTLTFANDGEPFSIEKTGSRKYSDFESLCSINTSSKDQNESIGNKGVGFKSCWEFTNRASIVSQHQAVSWGFELQRPCKIEQVTEFVFDGIEGWLQQEGVSSVMQKHGGTLPSFYFPRRLDESEIDLFINDLQQASTIITLHDISPEQCDELKDKIEEFSKHEFFFVKQLSALFDKNFNIHVIVDGAAKKVISTQAYSDKWLNGNVVVKEITDEEREELRELSRSLNYEVLNPKIAIAFPLFDNEHEPLDSRFYTYLPTEMRCGFNVLIHADFLLDVSRKNIDFADNKYNQRLLEHVADLFVETLESRTKLHQLEHFSKFLLPQDIDHPLAKLVWERLTSGGKITSILKEVYKGQSSEKACRLAFGVIDKWMVKHQYNEEWRSYYDRSYNDLLVYFCDPDIKIVFVEEGHVRALPTKPKGKSETDEKSKLFYIAKGSDAQDFSILREIDSIALSGMDELSKPELIKNRIVLENSNIEILRALASESESTDKQEIRADILRFIIARQKSLNGQLNIVHFSPQGNNPKEGHFLARIFLPCKDNRWHPANNCYFGLVEKIKNYLDQEKFHEVDIDRLKDLLGDDTGVTHALRHFGATDRLPIEKSASGNKGFILPWSSTPVVVGNDLKILINKSMPNWTSIESIEVLYEQLRNECWFYDEKHNAFCKPSEVFLFNDDVVRPAIGQEKKDSDLQLLYFNLGISSIEDTRDNAKLLNQLDRLKDDSGQICILHKRLYKQIILRLSRNKAEDDASVRDRLLKLPLLCEQGYVERDAWFVGRDAKKFKHHFQELDYLVFDDEVTNSFIRAIGRVKHFDPRFKAQPEDQLDSSIATHKSQTTGFKQVVEDKYLAAMFALADEALPINRFVKEQSLLRWQNLNILYAKDVWVEIELEGQIQNLGEGLADADVFFLPISESERADHSRIGQLIHDLETPCGHDQFSRFGEAIANGVFRDVNLGSVLRSFLTEAYKGDVYKEAFLNERGISISDVEEMQTFIRETLLSKDEKRALIKGLQDFFKLDCVNEGSWNKLETYMECDKSYSDLEKRFQEERVRSVISQLNPVAKNIQQIKENKERIQLCFFIEKGVVLSDDEFNSKVQSEENRESLKCFKFNVEEVIQKLFDIKKISLTDAERQSAEIRLETGNLPVLNLELSHSTQSQPVLRSFQDAVGTASKKTSVVQVSTEKREQQAKDQGRRGIAVEKLMCNRFANAIVEENLQDSLMEKISELYKGEQFAEGYLSKVADSGNSLNDIIALLHVSKSMGDGLGYDILEPVIKDGALDCVHMVEVKASQAGATIYLSKNEYRKILGFANETDNASSCWRLYHVLIEKNKTIDRTSVIKDAVKQFNTVVDQVPGKQLALLPDTWVIQFEAS